MKKIAIITARGGSKRIPKKNIKEFCGKPIVAYSIEAALNSKVFDEIMVSTDSNEIANIAIGSRLEAMKLRADLEIQKLKTNDVIRVRIIGIGVKHIIVDMYGKEVVIKAYNLKHTYIVNCKNIYNVRRLFTGKN